MKDRSRRKFVQGLAATVAAGPLVAASSAQAAAKPAPKAADVLYRETDEWRMYFETLR